MTQKILVVDDDEEGLKLIGLALERAGFQIVIAPNGTQALEKAVSEAPDLVVLDVMMPDMDGVEVCRRLRANPATQGLGIIMFTAKVMVDDKVAGFEAGADDYLTKPTRPAELVAHVKALLARRGVPVATTERTSDGTTLGFLGAKGGVGLSTLAGNIAASLAAKGPTVLADFRLGQGTLGMLFGQPRASGIANLVSKPAAEINSKVVEAELLKHASGLRLLLSSTRPKEANLNASPETMAAIVKTLRGMARSVVVDLGSGLSRQTARLLREIDALILVVEPHRAALLMAHEIMREIEPMGITAAKMNIVLVNRAPSSVQISWQEAEQILGHEMLAVISPAPEIVFQAAEANQPIAAFQPSAVIANQMGKLAEELAKR